MDHYFLYTKNPNNFSYSNNNNEQHSSSSNGVKPVVEDNKKKKKKSKKISGACKEVKLSTDPQSVAARERRHRISERFKILQSLVPGGTKLDTVSMLEEAIHYVKFLKTQILWLNHQPLDQHDTNDPTSLMTLGMNGSVGQQEAMSMMEGTEDVCPQQGVDDDDDQMVHVGFSVDQHCCWSQAFDEMDVQSMHFCMGAYMNL